MLELVEKTLDEVLPSPATRPVVLSEAMRYAVGTGGKRVRPLICLGASLAVGGTLDDAKYPAAAIELLHNYTLIHDDLPAMDNDRERRGQPTVWVKFGEANAILAGDALLALAFRVAAKAPRHVAAIIDALADKGVGVVQGQVEDIESALSSSQSQCKASNSIASESHTSIASESQTLASNLIESQSQSITCNQDQDQGLCAAASMPRDDFIYRHKTADLFIAAAHMGALAGGGDAAALAALERFALNLGLAFQYEDDLIDGDGLYPRAETERLVRETTAAALAALDTLPGDTSFLRALSAQLVGRSH